jgi:hypothetical protein
MVRLLKDRGTYSSIKLSSGQTGYLRSNSLRIVYTDELPENQAAEKDTGQSASPGPDIAATAGGDETRTVTGQSAGGVSGEKSGAVADAPAMDPSTYPSEPDNSEPIDDGVADEDERNDPLGESIKRLYEIHRPDE